VFCVPNVISHASNIKVKICQSQKKEGMVEDHFLLIIHENDGFLQLRLGTRFNSTQFAFQTSVRVRKLTELKHNPYDESGDL